jgi:hypothetical protein
MLVSSYTILLKKSIAKTTVIWNKLKKYGKFAFPWRRGKKYGEFAFPWRRGKKYDFDLIK